jgi:hypothetical protein
MHVGWAATFRPPEGRPAPGFEELRDHIASRLCRAPRYRQRIATVPLGLNAPIWVDDERFDVNRHVVASRQTNFADLVDSCMSTQLRRDRPLWQICVAERLDDGRIGIVGKAHHCMVDGIAAVELASLLLDPTPHPPPEESDGWLPSRPPEPHEPVNQPITGARHLAWFRRPLADLKRIGRPFGASVNDVLLAASAGGMRRFLIERDRDPVPLKTMVPVNVRAGDPETELGNRILRLRRPPLRRA